MKKIKIFGLGGMLAFSMLYSTPTEARCITTNKVETDGHIHVYTDCYFLGIRYSHSDLDMGAFVLAPTI